ncbi:MAG: hypothetical protein ACXAEX_20590 [Promethearchaeota archaeon]
MGYVCPPKVSDVPYSHYNSMTGCNTNECVFCKLEDYVVSESIACSCYGEKCCDPYGWVC